MGKLESTITIKSGEYRPCMVNGKKALFHKWTEKENVILQCNRLVRSTRLAEIREEYEKTNIVPNGFSAVKFGETYAIVEFEKGEIELVNPQYIQFLDSGNVFYENAMFFREETTE